MKIWRLDVDMHDYESFQLIRKEREFLKDFRNRMSCGERQNGQFDNLEIEIVETGKPSDLPKFWSFSGTMIFSEKAKVCLEELLKNCVEFIPLKSKQNTYYLVNIVQIIDAVDYEKAVLRKLNTGLVVGFEKIAFKSEYLQKENMFKVLLNGKIFYTEIYVSSELKERIEEELEGFKFIEVWDSEEEM